MAYRLTEWPLMIRDHPAQARKTVVDALHKTGGNVVQAAEELEMSRRSMWYVIRALKLHHELEAIREEYRKKPARYLKAR